MNHIIKSARKILREMENDNEREITIYKIIKKYYDDFGVERGEKLLNAIMKHLSEKNKAKRITDYEKEGEPVLEMMMGPESTVDELGDSLINSEKFERIIKDLDISEFENEYEYADFIILLLTAKYIGTPIHDDLFEYLKDVYFEDIINLYTGESENDSYYLTP